MEKYGVQKQAFKYFDRYKKPDEQRSKNGTDTGNKYAPKVIVLTV